MKRWGKMLVRTAAAAAVGCLCFWLLQRYWAHRNEPFVPDYPRVELTEHTDAETMFLQTGLGKSATAHLLEEGKFQTILDAQAALFDPPPERCAPLLGWFTREDRLTRAGTPLVDLRPGDILLTLSTHTAGWRHGHGGLVIDGDTVLECAVLGQDSRLTDVEHWNTYSCYAVLRVRGANQELGRSVASYAMEHLLGVPYRLTIGLWGEKAPGPDSAGFGLHCIYLPWYAWKQFGYDLDGDGGRVVTAQDLLRSGLVEAVQVYGMDPEKATGLEP